MHINPNIKRNPDSVINNLFAKYQQSAKIRGLIFNLQLEEFKQITSLGCYYCGRPPSNRTAKRGRCLIYNGVDRVNNSIGYVLENCVPCCKMCNVSKLNFSKEEFFSWIKEVYEHSINSGRI